MEDEDRISQLPGLILDHILSLLPQNDAVRTCILSKSWRHLGPTRPKIEFHESDFPESQEKFVSVVENTLRRYDDQKLSIQEFVLEILEPVHSDEPINSIPLLDKWIPIVLLKKGLKTFRLSADYFPLPLSLVFEAEFLEELFLKGCNLDYKKFNSTGKVRALSRLRTLSLDSVFMEESDFEKIMTSCPLVQHLFLSHVKLPREWLNNLPSSNNNCLRTLSLGYVRIEEETFEKIMSICPLIDHLVLKYCPGLRTIKVKMARNLKHLECHVLSGRENGSIEIIDAPSLETISINDCRNWYLNKNNYFFPRLKSLYLWNVRLPTELLNNLSSNNFPCLEELQLRHCSRFSESIKLSNRSIKRLIIVVPHPTIKAANIDSANMLHFEYITSDYLPSISFTTTLRAECKSSIYVGCYSDTAWYCKLHEFLKALSQSQISLETSYFPEWTNQDMTCEPVVVDHLCLNLRCSDPEIQALLNRAFRICRPRYVGMPLHRKSHKRFAVPIWKALVEKGETKFWQQDLEESSIQLSDKNTDEWRSVQVCALSDNENIRFKLKWRDLS